MDKRLITFEVAAPEELQNNLSDYERVKDARFAAVEVYGPHVMTRQFHFPYTSTPDLISGLKLDASETLSIPAIDVEVAYQITSQDEQGVHGVYSAMPAGLLKEYLASFKPHPLVPVSLIHSTIGVVNNFLRHHPLPMDNYCLVHFVKPHAVNIIICADAKLVFFRELYDLSEQDFKDKIMDTIRYTFGRTVSKRIDHIVFTGDITGKDALMTTLKKLENPASPPPIAAPASQVDLSGLDFFQKYVVGLPERNQLVRTFSLVTMFFVLLAAFLMWHLVNGYTNLQNAKAKTKMSDYQHAKALQEQLRHLNNAQ